MGTEKTTISGIDLHNNLVTLKLKVDPFYALSNGIKKNKCEGTQIEKVAIKHFKNKCVPFSDQSFENTRSFAQHRTRIRTGPKNNYMGSPIINS